MKQEYDKQRLMRYVKLDGHAGVKVSDDYYFYITRVDGVMQIFKSAYDKPWPHQLTFFEEGVDGFSLSPDGMMLAVIVNFKGSEHNPIALVDTLTGHSELVFWEKDTQSGTIVWKQDSSAFLFRSNHENKTDFKIYEFKIFPNSYELLIDTQGWAAPLGYSPSGEKVLYIIANSNSDQNLYLYDCEKSESKKLTNHEGSVCYEARFGSSDDEIFVLTNEGRDFNRLYHWDLSTEESKHLGPELDWECQGLQVSRCGRYVMFCANEEGYSNLYVIDGWMNRQLPSPETKGVIGSYHFRSDMSIVFTYQFPKRASQVYSYDLKEETTRQLTWSSAQGLNPHEFIQPRLIHFESFDGLNVPAFLFLPKGYKRGKKIPMVLHFHGGPEGQFRPMFYKHFQYLLELGIGVCAPNIRGSSGYGSSYMALDDYKLRMDSVKDGAELAHYLVNQGMTDYDKLGVVGGSYGGFMVLALITNYPEIFSAAVDVVGISNLVTFLQNTKPYRRALREKEYGPLSDEEFLKSISPINKIDNVKTPLLVVHGETDPRVPLEEAQQVVDRLQELGREVEALYFPDEGHGVRKLANQIVYYERMIQFFVKYLK